MEAGGRGEVPVGQEEIRYMCYQEESAVGGRRMYRGVLQMKERATRNRLVELFGGRGEFWRRRQPVEGFIGEALSGDRRTGGPWFWGRVPQQKSILAVVGEAQPHSGDGVVGVGMKRAVVERSARRKWQSVVWRCISKDGGGRLVHWVYGVDGGEGKSWFGKRLQSGGGWNIVSVGNYDEMVGQYYSLGVGRDVVVDVGKWVRPGDDVALFRFLSEILDGRLVVNGEGGLRVVCFGSVRVVVLSSSLPDFSRIGVERVCLHTVVEDRFGVAGKGHGD